MPTGSAWSGIRSARSSAGLLADGQDPCARCSLLPARGLYRFAREHGFNRVALAHHHDDAVETFLMSILYSGKIQTFLPRTELEAGLTLIRPSFTFARRKYATIGLDGLSHRSQRLPL